MKDLSKIKKVHETTDFREANKFLTNGWKLLESYHGKSGYVYVLSLSE